MDEVKRKPSFLIRDILGDVAGHPLRREAPAFAAVGGGDESALLSATFRAAQRRETPAAPLMSASRRRQQLLDEQWARVAPELLFLQTFCSQAATNFSSMLSSRFTHPPASHTSFLPYERPERTVSPLVEDSNKQRKCRRSRTVFTEMQLLGLEKKFEAQKYLSTPDRVDLASSLGLNQLQVKTWYQNRRMKWKKEAFHNGEAELLMRSKGRPRKSQSETDDDDDDIDDIDDSQSAWK